MHSFMRCLFCRFIFGKARSERTSARFHPHGLLGEAASRQKPAQSEERTGFGLRGTAPVFGSSEFKAWVGVYLIYALGLWLEGGV